MDILVDFVGHVIVDNLLNTLDIQTTGSHSGGHQNWHSSRLEARENLEKVKPLPSQYHLKIRQSPLSLSLQAITVDRSGRIAFFTEITGQEIRILLCLNKHNCSVASSAFEQLDQLLTLFKLWYVVKQLFHVRTSSTHNSNFISDGIFQKVYAKEIINQTACVLGDNVLLSVKDLMLAGKVAENINVCLVPLGGMEPELTTLSISGATTERQSGNEFIIRSKQILTAHVQHPVSFIQYQEPHVFKGDLSLFNKIHESSDGGNQYVTS